MSIEYKRKLNKWTLARNQNAEHVYNLFKEEKERVELLVDDLLDHGATPLVILRKDYFEQLVYTADHRDLLVDFTKRHMKIVEQLVAFKLESLKSEGV